MNDVLKILLVDDNPDDRAMAMREIGQVFPDCRFHHATNPKELFLPLNAVLGRGDNRLLFRLVRWHHGLLSVKARNPDAR